MRDKLCHLFLIAGLMALSSQVSAAPPSSCASKFVGTWVYPGGTTVVAPGGTAYPKCPMCVATQSWTCQGNTYLFSNSGPPGQFSATLSADGRQMVGSTGIVATRVGGAAKIKEVDNSVKLTSEKTEKKTAAIPRIPSSSGQQQRSAPAPNSMPKSASCSDITGLGGTSGSNNCKPSTGVPPNLQAQIDKAHSSLQAAQTVKQSDSSAGGQAAAAAQFRNAAEAFCLAGDLARAQAAMREAQTIEAALSASPNQSPSARQAQPPVLSSQIAALPADQPPPQPKACPPVAPARYWEGTPNADYCAHANCVDRGSAYYGVMCFGSAATADGDATRSKAPARFKGVAPDIRAEVFALSDSIIDKPDDDPDRAGLVRALERRLADHRIRMKPQDLACLQPTSGTGRRLQDVPLRWHPEHIKKEAIDRSHLCDGVPEGDAKEVCRESKYGQAVMWAELELAGQCRTAEMPNRDIDAIAECAKRKFLNAWANSRGIVSAPRPANWVLPATCNATASPSVRKSRLRDLLAASLSGVETAQENTNEGGTADNQIIENSPPPPPPFQTDENEAYCNYMARAVVRGELTPGPATAIPSECRATIAAALALKAKQQADGVHRFSMNADETDKEIRFLMGTNSPQPKANGPN